MTAAADWRERGPGVYTCVLEPDTVTLGLVVGAEAALLVDTGSTPAQGREVREAVGRLTDRPLTHVVLTHAHHDHAFGLAAFADLVSVAHESVAGELRGPGAAREAERLGLDPAELALPGRGLVVATAVDLGRRRVEVAHLGRGHTAGDLVVVVPDADLLFVGDLLESAGAPWYGPDSHPAEWGASLDGVIGLMTASTRAVPGHGEPVDRLFAFAQRGEVAAVDGEIRRLVAEGVPAEEALAAGSWLFPPEHVAAGVARGYAELAAAGVTARRQLPLA